MNDREREKAFICFSHHSSGQIVVDFECDSHVPVPFIYLFCVLSIPTLEDMKRDK